MKPKIAIFMPAVLLMAGLVGCGSEEPQNMMEGVDAQALADYDAMIAADEAAMSDADADGGASE